MEGECPTSGLQVSVLPQYPTTVPKSYGVHLAKAFLPGQRFYHFYYDNDHEEVRIERRDESMHLEKRERQ